MKRYEITEKDIDTVLKILKASDPENATPELAIAVLEDIQIRIHELSHIEPEKLVEIYKKLKEEKRLKTN